MSTSNGKRKKALNKTFNWLPKLIAAISYFTLACILNRLVVRAICLVCGQHERDMTKMEKQPKANCHRVVICCYSVGNICSNSSYDCGLVTACTPARTTTLPTEHNRSEKRSFWYQRLSRYTQENLCIRTNCQAPLKCF